MLFPMRLDDTVFNTTEAWALKLRDNRNIGDFRAWNDRDAYQRTLERLLRDLRIDTAVAGTGSQRETGLSRADVRTGRSTDADEFGDAGRAPCTMQPSQNSAVQGAFRHAGLVRPAASHLQVPVRGGRVWLPHPAPGRRTADR